MAMPPGGVIVDLAAERGGNCALTKLNERVHAHDVTILGPGNLPATVPYHASQMYSKNICNLLGLLVKDGVLNLDMNDEVIAGTCASHQSEVLHTRLRGLLGLGELDKPAENSDEAAAAPETPETASAS